MSLATPSSPVLAQSAPSSAGQTSGYGPTQTSSSTVAQSVSPSGLTAPSGATPATGTGSAANGIPATSGGATSSGGTTSSSSSTSGTGSSLAPFNDRDYPIPGGWFYSQESRTPQDTPPYRGYTVVDDADAAFWTEFRRFGGLDTLGYPVSRRYQYPAPNGYISQAFERGILQWRPDLGQAELANVFDQFTQQGLDDALEVAGIPRPQPGSDLSFNDDAARRMSWLTDPELMARFFLNPLTQEPFGSQEEAWSLFGLPESFPERPIYFREKANGKYGPPLYLPYIAQRFQKAGLELFLEDQPTDPTVVPGDAKRGCVAMTAVGRLARSIGNGKIIPGPATLPEPAEKPPRVHFIASIPPATGANLLLTFELIGTGFQPGESVTIRLQPLAPSTATMTTVLIPVVSHVDATMADGSFDQTVSARVGQYQISISGDRSHRTLDPNQSPLIDLSQPSAEFLVPTHALCQ